MGILVVDDSSKQRMILQHFLLKGGLTDNVLLAASADEAFKILGLDTPDQAPDIDVILMDIVLPGINGIEASRIISSKEYLRDIPIIMVTGMSDLESLQLAFSAGAMDYVVKPVQEVELHVRVRSLLMLKSEMDLRKRRERELMETARQLTQANQMLERLSLLDGLTEIANRRYFDMHIEREWKRATREKRPLSLLFIDIDYFKSFNDTYGHQSGDECLKQVAKALNNAIKRPGDFVARYGGEEFAVILPDTDLNGAVLQAEAMCHSVADLGIDHASSTVAGHVTISIGVGAAIPGKDQEPSSLIAAADLALYEAKQEGRNRFKCAALD